MLFHSYSFIFGFLPICFLVFIGVNRRWGWDCALLWLAGASVFFYGQWSLALAGLLTGSIIMNYLLGRVLEVNRDSKIFSRCMLILAITANLGLLGYFKYTNFFMDNINAIAGTSFSHLNILFPVGISFYTFIQIGYLVEVYNRQASNIKFSHYFLFASFFPYVTAGPLVLQKEMMAQFAEPKQAGFDPARFTAGLAVFSMGLFKKLLLADGIAPYADAVFNGAAGGMGITPGIAWIGAFAYTLQLYFDFSGYSDMALGLGYIFGIRLPLNFNSPLKAVSIIDFWRRWHMTMTRFFTNYVYTPIAVKLMRRSVRNSYGRVRRVLLAAAFPALVTFVLAGLWHGAGWTFVIFGTIHGVALAINHIWRETRLPSPPYAVGWILTMCVVIAGMVIFRAESVPVALTLLGNMIGLGAAGQAAGTTLAGIASITLDTAGALGWIAALMAVALLCPNTHEIMRNHWVSSDPKLEITPRWFSWLTWRPSPAWAVAGAIVVLASVGSIASETTFIYYRF